ncbi:MAG: bifunctional histidinol-phosphatase/imidazoleglycerol-phosphate dehydratase HisB [Thermoanaerobaculia bacterium]|nr:bifunctional histidinol-phosphatase/imidazoleglycerol-phosphate dehydratase HisB [Thermoanaerobaculia bacterium]
MQKILFIDRDGTIIVEPQPSQQIDSLEKMEFIPGVIYALARIVRELDYKLVIVSNQDGLGTDSFPEQNFWPAQEKMLKILAGEGITFYNIHIDRSFPHELLPTRKPGIAMLAAYLDGNFDLANSYVIGDRLTDVKLARNLGAKAILLRQWDDPAGHEAEIDLIAENWEQIYQHLRLPPRRASHRRTTRETDISIDLCLDGSGNSQIKTGLGFFDHMLDQLARHGNLDLCIEARGDLHIDEHHSIEDTALALGETFALALSDKRGLERYGSSEYGLRITDYGLRIDPATGKACNLEKNPCQEPGQSAIRPEVSGQSVIPMDDALARVVLDFGGRPWLVWQAEFHREKIGEMPTEMFFHFFKSFSDAARCNLNIRAEGQNEHHKIEAIFKAFARAVKMAVRRDPVSRQLPTTKGQL